ncbi:hypothetical protein BOO35_16590 [Vibrio navarrensis]|uniref:hypothetical protein n=1 Tax=Vibrio navarrensis TaxID=29495 RepID=UPI001865F932|nr:hypothetical protein [Vibrio navarrensis]MBE3666689.1 hypothetical protein [Vibrio navarrensis]
MSHATTTKCDIDFERGHLSERVLSDIVAQLGNESEISQDTLSRLQVRYPELRFTLCFDEEMGSHEAYIEASGFDLHLVSHRLSGCSSLTQELTQASGVVIALHDR